MSYVLYGVSGELQGIFESLREQSSVADKTGSIRGKYRNKDIDALAQMILCRNYAKATLELSYLLLAVALRDEGAGQTNSTEQVYLQFFWLDEAITPVRFRAAFADFDASEKLPPNERLVLAEPGLSVRLGGDEFTLSPTRIGVLAALLEFMVYIDPGVLRQDENFYQSPTVARVNALASRLQSVLYRYLGENMQAAQQQRRFRRLWDWLCSQPPKMSDKGVLWDWLSGYGDAQAPKMSDKGVLWDWLSGYGDSQTPKVSDEGVLCFWQEAALAEDDSLGFRRFRTVAENFYDLGNALDCVQSHLQVDLAASIGQAGDVGEISPDVLEKALETLVDERPGLDSLSRSPKFLSKQQIDTLQPVVDAQCATVALPLTALRMHCFGTWQAVLVQALRNKDQAQMQLALQAGGINYDEYLGNIDVLLEALSQARLSGLHVLLHYQVPDVLALLIDLLPATDDADMVSGATTDRPSVMALLKALDLDANNLLASGELDQVANAVFKQWPQVLLRVPALNALQQRLQQAFKSNNRQGFKTLPDQVDTTQYLDGVALLALAQRYSGQHKNSLEKKLHTQGSAANYRADLAIFKQVFTALYGDQL